MILIDAQYINEGGGKVLLYYLIENFEKMDIDFFFLLDERIRYDLPTIKSSNRIEFLSGSFLKRHWFYKRNRNRFSKVFCFANLPPSIRLKCEVFTYFQNVVFLEVPNEYSKLQKIKFDLKRQVLKYFDPNTTCWLVQSDLVKNKLQSKLDVNSAKVLVLPFYPQFEKCTTNVIRERQTYIYVSNGMPHKNHIRLINVFCEFYDRYKKGKLILTIGEDFPVLTTLIADKVKKGYPIENIGFVDRATLQKLYLHSEFLIFPSLTESFGLGLIEAIECGCKILGADLAYTYEVCEPSIVFNPLSNESMFEAFEKSLQDDIIDSVPKIKNNINELINLLQSTNATN